MCIFGIIWSPTNFIKERTIVVTQVSLHGIDYEPFDFIGRGSHNTATCLFSRESEEISWVVSWFEGKFEWYVFLSIVATCLFMHAVNHKRDFRA